MWAASNAGPGMGETAQVFILDSPFLMATSGRWISLYLRLATSVGLCAQYVNHLTVSKLSICLTPDISLKWTVGVSPNGVFLREKWLHIIQPWGGERCCKSEVLCPRAQHDDRGSTQTTRSRLQFDNHYVFLFPPNCTIWFFFSFCDILWLRHVTLIISCDLNQALSALESPPYRYIIFMIVIVGTCCVVIVEYVTIHYS